ncbi:ATP-dependent DNA helicase DinG [Bacillus sp. B1-b2]|uniref:ATP-dependent DNA helicase DinG n=1 Tax=Bacillus sp. B1-b2 TaxID=2653201 RepID=UPI001261F07F|nr:ATP-dependent DNA helicase DinG [Bacillus sp. B1-b2]KAB7672955.1 ATP-dependent DNA helicase DinG [Bacillus sp. B1-b2]
MSNKFVVVDLETNGNSPKKGDRIIQFAAVVIEEGRIVEEYSSFVNPLQTINPFIAELTGITDDMVDTAPIFDEIADKVKDLLEDAYFVAHNVLFDLSFLNEELEQAGFRRFMGPFLDTVELSRILFPTADGYKLTDLATQQGIVHSRPHQADSDAYVTAELLLILLNKLEDLPLQTLKQLEVLSASLKSDLDDYLYALIQDKQTKTEYIPDHLETYRGLTLKKVTSIKKHGLMDNDTYSFDMDFLESRMRSVLASYKNRSGQTKMMKAIFDAFTEEVHGLIEAGTGVGKTLGYLIPASYFSIEKQKQIVISTHTTQLQEQLIQKDIPLLNEILPFPISFTVLKGRNHYISLDKFEVALREQEDNYDVIMTKMQLLIWLTETTTGDKDELNLTNGGIQFWNKIKNDGSFSLPISKEWAAKDFYRKTRNAAQKANIIITNHSLLVKDLTLEQKVLPAYDYAIIDEGHHFEKTANKHIGCQFSYPSVRQSLNYFGTLDQRQLFAKLETIMEANSLIYDKNELSRSILELQLELEELFRSMYRYVKQYKSKTKDGKLSTRLVDDGSRSWTNIKMVAERMLFRWKDSSRMIQDNLSAVLIEKKTLSSYQILQIERIQHLLNEWEEYRNILRETFIKDSSNIAWLEGDVKNFPNNAALYTQPFSIANILQETFFQKKKSVIFTSATITVNHSFEYYAKLLGLIDKNHIELQIDSPFQYDKQVELLIPNDIPEINSVTLDEYTEAICKHIIKMAKTTKGRMLILFTANDMLRKSYELLKDSGQLEEYAILAQGITTGSRMRLTKNFQRYEKAILLGTNSFWEGIDIPGEDLTCLIIVRLPFSSPEEPLTEAKNERIRMNGGNPFLENSLPEAVLRFKQGFGRLIRSEDDRGLIIVFDRRIVTTSYGDIFMQSIPNVPVRKKDIHELIAFMEEWL